MPIISKESVWFDGRKCFRTIRVDRQGTFRIELPSIVCETLGLSHNVFADTREAAIRAFNEALEAYRVSQTKTRKVIVYWFTACCDIQPPEQDQDWLKLDEISFLDGCGLGLLVDVCNEVSNEHTTTRGESERHYRYIRSEDACCIPNAYRRSNGHDHWRDADKPLSNVLAWTPEREQAIAELCRRMDVLITQLHHLFADKKQFEIRLDDMKSLPMPSGK